MVIDPIVGPLDPIFTTPFRETGVLRVILNDPGLGQRSQRLRHAVPRKLLSNLGMTQSAGPTAGIPVGDRQRLGGSV